MLRTISDFERCERLDSCSSNAASCSGSLTVRVFTQSQRSKIRSAFSCRIAWRAASEIREKSTQPMP